MAGSGKKRGGIAFILLALLLILVVGGVLGYMFILKPMLDQSAAVVEQATLPAVETVDIVITAQSVSRGSILTDEVLTTIAYPKSELAEGTFFTTKEDVIGASARYNLDARVPLTPTMITEASGTGWSPSFDIPQGKTAVSMPISRLTAVSFAPQPGDHIMIVGCMLITDLDQEFQSRVPNLLVQAISSGTMDPTLQTSLTISILGYSGTDPLPVGRGELDPRFNQPVYVLPSESPRPRLVCQNVIQDAIVMKIGEFDPNAADAPVVQPAAEEAAPVQPGTEAEAAPVEVVVPDLVTVIVSPQEAVLLNYMMLSGVKLNLALRNPTDPQVITTDAVTLQYLMDQKAIPLPAKVPFGLEPRVDELLFATEAKDAAATATQP